MTAEEIAARYGIEVLTEYGGPLHPQWVAMAIWYQRGPSEWPGEEGRTRTVGHKAMGTGETETAALAHLASFLADRNPEPVELSPVTDA